MKGHHFKKARSVGWRLLALLLLPALILACTGTSRSQTEASQTGTPTQPAATPPAPASQTPSPSIPETGAQPTEPAKAGCPPTAPDARASAPLTLGPINGAAASTAAGERLIITGTVYDQTCRPVTGMTLRFWQTDPEGVYGPGHGTNNMVCCYYGGETVTDDQGRYTVLTVMPGLYLGEANPPPAHIHVEGEHPSGARLESEIVFENDPHLMGSYTNPPPVALAGASDDQGPFSLGVADFHLAEEIAAVVVQPAGVHTFTILPGESSASYQIREKFADIAEMVSPVGTTGDVEGEIQLDLSAGRPALIAMSVTVDLRGLTTDDPMRDEKLANRWLVTNTYPYATFTAREAKGGPAAYQEGQPAAFVLSGDLTIRDVTRPVDFAVTASLNGDAIDGQAEARILMSDFGIDPPNLLGFVKVEDEVVIRIHIRAVRS